MSPIAAPAPLTEKRSAAPVKSSPAATVQTPDSWSRISSKSPPAARGATWVMRSGPATRASAMPAGPEMVTDVVDLAGFPAAFEALKSPGPQCKVMLAL